MRLAGWLAVVIAAVMAAGCSVNERRASTSSSDAVLSPSQAASVPDAVPRVEPRSRRGNPESYEIAGKRYYVLQSEQGFVERGVASWYGPQFHGRLTSLGETYDMYAMTAAHTRLPLPCYARVTNLRNGRSVVVRVNDRGPFVANRVIDLSYAAAVQLDMVRDGTTLVEVRAIVPGVTEDQLDRASQSPPPDLYIQAGAFADEQNAQRLVQRLRSAGFSNAFVQSAPVRGERLHRVRIGPVGSVAEFDRLATRLARNGVDDPYLAVD